MAEGDTTATGLSNEPAMGPSDHARENSPEASAGPNQRDVVTTPRPCTPAKLSDNAHSPPKKSPAESYRNPTADAGSRETTAQPASPPDHSSVRVKDLDITSDDELDALFDADLEAGSDAFQELGQDEEDEGAAEQAATPEEAEEDVTTRSEEIGHIATWEARRTPAETSPLMKQHGPSECATPHNDKCREEEDIDIAPLDWFGPAFEEELNAGSVYFEGWAQGDEDEEPFEQQWTPAESEADVSNPDAESSHGPTAEKHRAPARESYLPRQPIRVIEKRETPDPSPRAHVSGSRYMLEDGDNDMDGGAGPEASPEEVEDEGDLNPGDWPEATPTESGSGSPRPSQGPTRAPGLASPFTPGDHPPSIPCAQQPQTPGEEPPHSSYAEPPVGSAKESAANLGSREATSEPPTITVRDDVLTQASTLEDVNDGVTTSTEQALAISTAPIAGFGHQETAEQVLLAQTYDQPYVEEPPSGISEKLPAEIGTAETTKDVPSTSLDGRAPSGGNASQDNDPSTGLSVLEQTQDSRMEPPQQPATDVPAGTWSRETTAQLPETPPNPASTNAERHTIQADEVLPKYSTSVAERSSASERHRIESEAVVAMLREYLTASPSSAKTVVGPSATSSADAHVQNEEPPVQAGREPSANISTQKPTAQPPAPSATLVTGIAVETRDTEAPRDDSDSLPDYESLPDYLDEVREIVPGSQDSRTTPAQRPQIQVAQPTPLLSAPQTGASSSNPDATVAKRPVSATSADLGQMTKRIRIVLKRTPSPQPPRGELEGGSSTNGGAVDANKRRRSSDPGPGLVTKRPRIILKRRTPQPAPPPAAVHDVRRDHPSVPPEGPSQEASQAWLEDQISPMTVVQPARPAEEASRPKKSTRRTKPPPRDKPSTSNLTWATVESLLPTSAFGQASWIRRRFWTVKEEIELRNAWSEDDESALCISHSEVLCGQFVKQLYGCQLADLFRYGLKYISPGPDRKGNPTDETFWVNLLRLLPHPFFQGRIEILRYALQAAIFYRTSDFAADNLHVNPFMPPWSHTEAGYISWLKELRAAYPAGSSGHTTKTVEILEASEWRCRTQIGSKMWMQELTVVMDTWIDKFDAQFPPQHETHPLEYYLFVLTERDLGFIEACLDELDREQRRRQEQRAKTWQERHRWRETYAGEIPYVEEHRGYHRPDVEFQLNPGPEEAAEPEDPAEKNVPLLPVTVDSSFLQFWLSQSREAKFVTLEQNALYRAEKRLAVLAERREALIRSKVAGANGGAGAGELRTVLDVPPFDPDPDFHLFEEVVARRTQDEDGIPRPVVPIQPGLMVVSGVYTTPATAEWLAGWRRRKAEAAAGSGRRRNPRRMVRLAAKTPDSAVARVLGSGYVPVAEEGGDRGPSAPVGSSALVGGLADLSVEGTARTEHGAGEEGAQASQMAAARSSIGQQQAAYGRTFLPPDMLSMGGGLWARRKARRVARQ